MTDMPSRHCTTPAMAEASTDGWPGNQRVTLGDARNGAVVELDDGQQGVLQWLRRDHRRATVRVGTRHLRIDAERIVRVVRRGDERDS